jgi:hypothetical protein
LAHFLDPYTGTPLSSVEVLTDGETQIALWGGGPGPDYDPLEVTFVPSREGSIHPKDGHDVGNNTRIFWIKGKLAGDQLHALNDGNDYAQPVSIVKVEKFYRSIPPAQLQNHTKSECWAAALAAWVQVVPGRPRLSKQALIDKYSDLEDDGLSEITLTTDIVRDFSMGWWASKSANFNDLRISQLRSRLQQSGHLYFIYKSGVQSSHSLCVYGVGCPDGKEPKISSMDPWYGRAYHRTQYEFYRRPLFIAWPY